MPMQRSKRARYAYSAHPEQEEQLFFEMIVKYIRERGLSNKLLKCIYEIPSGREAIRQTINAHTLKVDDMNPDKLTACISNLSNFPALISLTIERSFGVSHSLRVNGLRHLHQLKKLKIKNFLGNDLSFMHEITHLGELEELIVENPISFSAFELTAITYLRNLRSFSLISLPDAPIDCTFDQLNACSNLQNLVLKLGRRSKTPNFNAIARLPLLHTLVLSFKIQSVQIDAIAHKAELRALTFECALAKDVEHNLSRLTQLSRLEFHTTQSGPCDWLKEMQSLRCLSIFWLFTCNSGKLTDSFPSTLHELTLRGIYGTIREDVLSRFDQLKKLRLHYTVPKNGEVHKYALEPLVKIEDLLLRCVCYGEERPLPYIDHMTGLTKLNIDTRTDFKLLPLEKELHQLRDLTLGMNLGDKDLETLSRMWTLETLILQQSNLWTFDGLFYLNRLPKLRDLCLYCCKDFPVSLEKLYRLLMEFKALQHLGLCPLSDYNAQFIPNPFLRQLTVFEKKDAVEYFELRRHRLYYVLHPSIVDDALVIDDGFRVLNIDADCRLD